MSLYQLHYIAGLQALGYDVQYVERQNTEGECYDPVADEMTDNPRIAIAYLDELLPKFGIARGEFSFIDMRGVCHGRSWNELRTALDRADFMLTLCDRAWCDDFGRCKRRAFVDGDPLFTQAAMLEPDGNVAALLSNYDTLFTYASRIGMADCTVPLAGREWIATRPIVATQLWKVVPGSPAAPVAAVMQWTGGQGVTLNGDVYGYKNREFMRFAELPRRTSRSFVLAIGGPSPTGMLMENRWKLVKPLEISATIDAYQSFIASTHADLGIAKHAYVASRSGWFSDRSTCYLGAGRPVLHQDTGFTDWLPVGEGVIPFSSIEEVLDGLERIDADYDRHSRAARCIAEEHFEASTVVGQMLDNAGMR